MRTLKVAVLYLFLPFALGGLAGILSRVAMAKGFGSSEMASWVQAVGATVGLAIAIWVPYKQQRDVRDADAERQRENTLRTCLALIDELQLMRDSFDGPLFKELLRTVDNVHYGWELPVSSNPHPIYNALARDLINIDDAATRQSIIKAYGASAHLSELLQLNTKYLHQLMEVQIANKRDAPFPGPVVHGKIEDGLKSVLVSLRTQLREAATMVQDHNTTALDKLAAEASRYR